MQTANAVRKTFLDYFKANGHEVKASASLIPHNDPTLMFTAAGMVPFKNIFTGAQKPSFPRVTTSQKCVRAGGKHNDLENVGYTARHHTFFEMLGNFSFGDYFKEEAIVLAWDLITKDYGLNPDRICVTVYHDDDTAWNQWKKLTGFADHRIIRINSNDNFWSAGDTGPCGPCSEIFYDHGEHIFGGPPGSPDQDGDRFVEIWNLVFMQYDQLANGERVNLPKPSIDTGMGLERMAAVMQGVPNNYDIDLFKAIISASKQASGNAAHETSHRVIADHLRASGFLIADGVLPSNEGRGYVLRRIMRRAMRHAHQLGCKDPLMFKLVPSLVEQMGEHYPELKRAQASITDNLLQEEERFKETLGRGLKLLEEEAATIAKGGKLSGVAAFKLYDTYGFPLDLTQDILKARGIEVDEAGFEKSMDAQREMARAAWSGSGDKATGKIWFELKEKLGPTKFIGYADEEAHGTVIALVKDGETLSSANAGDDVFVVLDQTPFYGESGGQVGDRGEFENIATISDTQKPIDDFIIHKAKLKAALKVGDKINATIDISRRNQIRSNHSATHLLHKALQDALGEHVTQKGSLVDSERLRFDFSHPKGLSREDRTKIEQAVNDVIWRGGDAELKEMSPDDAIKAGAMALFGEKYGDTVRVLSLGKTGNGETYSIELCGGTHVGNTGDIGMFTIVSEGSVASGVRRIEAVTKDAVRKHFADMLAQQNALIQKLGDEQAHLLNELEARGKKSGSASTIALTDLTAVNNADARHVHSIFKEQSQRAEDVVRQLQDSNKKLGKIVAEAKREQAVGNSEVEIKQFGNIQFIGQAYEGLDPKELRGLAESFLKKTQRGVVAVGSNSDGKGSVVVAVDKFVTDMHSAVALVQAAVTVLGGKGGGGKAEMAQGGGPEGDKITDAIQTIQSMIG